MPTFLRISTHCRHVDYLFFFFGSFEGHGPLNFSSVAHCGHCGSGCPKNFFPISEGSVDELLLVCSGSKIVKCCAFLDFTTSTTANTIQAGPFTTTYNS